MSAQTPDYFIHEDFKYCFSSTQFLKEVFSMEKLGINPDEPDTACWRGYVATFSVIEKMLVLKDLHTNNGYGILSILKKPVTINGKKPEVIKFGGDWKYYDVNLPIEFTGKILITDDFIKERYVHMGFQSPLSFRRVMKLKFDNGFLIDSKDVSKVIARLRQRGHFIRRFNSFSS